jgi:hypothetical protein
MSAPTTRSTRREPLDGHVRPEDFRHRAACRSVDVGVFFPTAVRGREHERQVTIAKAVCAGCPVRPECLTWALSALPDGIAGGLTEHERRAEQAHRRQERRGRLPRPRTPQRPAAGTRAEIADAGRAAIAAGMPVREVAGEPLISPRTAARWARAQDSSGTTGACTTRASGEGPGCNQALHQISQHGTQAGTRAEGHRG